MMSPDTGCFEISHLDLATFLAFHDVWPDEIFYKKGDRHFWHRYNTPPPDDLLDEWNNPNNPVRRIIDTYNYIKRVSFGTRHTHRGQPVPFELPMLGGGETNETRGQRDATAAGDRCSACGLGPVGQPQAQPVIPVAHADSNGRV